MPINPLFGYVQADPLPLITNDIEDTGNVPDDIEEDTNQEEEVKTGLSADVEFFLANASTLSFVPVTGIVGNKKGNPMWLDKYTGILEDNVALEVNMPPAFDTYAFSMNNSRAMLGLDKWAASKNLIVSRNNTQTITKDMIVSIPELSEFGCSEDYVAYGDTPTSPRHPVTAKALGLNRFAAGHLHLSYDIDIIPQQVMIRWLDATIGLHSIFWDSQGLRRKFYGVAGLYRPTHYPNGGRGVEYRTLSNAWFFNNKLANNMGRAIFSLVNHLISDTSSAKSEYARVPWTDLQNCINSEDKKLARDVYNHVSKNCSIISHTLGYLPSPEKRNILLDTGDNYS